MTGPLLTRARNRLLPPLLACGALGACRAPDPSPVAAGGPSDSPWRLVWSDEFDHPGLPDPARWTYDVGGHGWGNRELQFYTEARLENAEVRDGHLHLTARREAFEGSDFTSTRLVSRGKGDFQYGRFEIRARVPEARGTWAAIWMMPSDWTFEDGNWPDVGEIDIMEHVGHDPGVIHASAHSRDYQWQTGTQRTGVTTVPTASASFHVYALEWSPEVLRAFVDDRLFFEYKNEGLGWTKWPYDKPFHLILNVAVGGAWGAAEGVDEAAFPQTLEVDYVRVFEAVGE
jgi:beta-glucanase (GH16 family)